MAKKQQICEICECLQGPDESASLGLSESKTYGAHLIYLMHAINYWMHAHEYRFGDETKDVVSIQDAQLIDAMAEIVKYRLDEGGNKERMLNWQSRKMINFWRRTGRRASEEPFVIPNRVDNA